DEESSEYRVLLARLPIEPRNFHVLALIAPQSEVHFAAWVTRLRQPRHDFQRERTDQGRRNLVIHESLRRRQRQGAGPTRGAGKGREIAPKHCCCWNVGGVLRRIGALKDRKSTRLNSSHQ